MREPYTIIFPLRIVPTLDAMVGSADGREAYFSLPFISFILSVSGSNLLKAAAASFLANVAVNVVLPIVTFISLAGGSGLVGVSGSVAAGGATKSTCRGAQADILITDAIIKIIRIIYCKLVVKNSVILSKGINSTRSYKSTWPALGTIYSSAGWDAKL